MLSHIYERLVYQDENLELKPGLATSWRPLSDTQWEFKLRDNVRFHDGSKFGADDVATRSSASVTSSKRLAAAFAPM